MRFAFLESAPRHRYFHPDCSTWNPDGSHSYTIIALPWCVWPGRYEWKICEARSEGVGCEIRTPVSESRKADLKTRRNNLRVTYAPAF